MTGGSVDFSGLPSGLASNLPTRGSERFCRRSPPEDLRAEGRFALLRRGAPTRTVPRTTGRPVDGVGTGAAGRECQSGTQEPIGLIAAVMDIAS